MRKLYVISAILIVLLSSSFLCESWFNEYEYTFPSYNKNYPPPAGYTHPFKLSQNYPDHYNKNEHFEWENINFKNRPKDYMQAVLRYCLEGNTAVNFKVEQNTLRKWYHAPWLHDDGKYNTEGVYMGNGREYIHGLTRERFTPAYDLHEKQRIDLESWAIGFYNQRGGYILNKVWRSGTKPKPELSNFPEGTVAFKLLLTDGTTQEIPYLKGTLEWTANIYPGNPLKLNPAELHRENRTVRLLQVDIAVKDRRADKTGWVFGTFIYNGFHKASTLWGRLVPVGLSWGDDSEITDSMLVKGAYLNKQLHESYINPVVIAQAKQSVPGAYMRHLGLGGRLNGPVDNSLSSCISCHARAANDGTGAAASFGKLTGLSTFSGNDFQEYFKTLPVGTGTFTQNGTTYQQTDYSMQVAIGIRNFYACQNIK